MGVGLRLKMLLRERNMTIKELAEISGIPKHTLYSITKRDSERVDAVVIQTMAKALNVSVEDLAGEERTLKKLLYSRGATNFLIRKIYAAADEAGVSRRELYEKVGLYRGPEEFRSTATVIRTLPKIEKLLNLEAGTFEKMLIEEFDPPANERDLLLDVFNSLNPLGQRTAIERIQELAQIPAYQKGKGIRIATRPFEADEPRSEDA